jgi:CDP-diacylglycerol---serine O-phosphatidyltransferase
MLTLSLGLAALEAARTGNWDVALRFILLAVIADGIDGALARQLRATSSIGEQLDSLADIIAFGAAPAFLFVTVYSTAPTLVLYGVALAFVLAGAFRLARFHAFPADGVFCGMPITAGGALLALTVAGPFGLDFWLASIAAGLTSVLMVSRIPFPKLSRLRPNMIGLMVLAAVPILVWPRTETLAIVAAAFAGAYVVWGLMSRVDLEDEIPGIGVEDEYEPSQQPR